MSGLVPCPGCAQLKARIAQLEAVDAIPRAGLCERCRGLRYLVRCVLCERDLCRDCAGTKTCSNALSGEHHTP